LTLLVFFYTIGFKKIKRFPELHSLPERTEMHKTRLYVIPILLLCATLSIIISGCYKSEAHFEAPPTTLTLTWDAPKNYTNGDCLADTDIIEYKVYYSTSHITHPTVSFYPIFIDPNSAATTISVNVRDMISGATGTYFFVVTAVDRNGAESDFSDEVSKKLY
jgi:hypothetical protein